MSSIGSVLSIARGAMSAQQTIIQTAGHNIANVETEGYSRQRVELSAATPQQFEYGSVGTGVSITNISQARDALLDSSYRDESGNAASSSLRQDLLGSVEGVLGEPSDTGLAAAMDAFWSSWSDLASQPTSAAARSVVQQRGQQVASMLNGFDSRLSDLAHQTSVRLDSTADRINTLSDQIAQLNGRVVASEFGGTTAGDLRDQRNLALDELSKLGDLGVIQNADGSVMVHLGTNTLVDGNNARHVKSVTTKSGDVALQMTSGTEPMLPVGGQVQAMIDFLNHDLKDVRGQLDALASGLVTSVNAVHNTGELYPSGGAAPVAAGDFFDPARTTAKDIALSATVAASAQNIAAGAAAGQNAAGPGNNEIALTMAQLRDTAAQVSYVDRTGRTQTGSFTSYYNDVNSRLGTQVSNAASDAEVHSTLASQADTRRQSVSGVNLDEELTTLMRAQQAYAAAAKVISTANEMMDTLVQMV